MSIQLMNTALHENGEISKEYQLLISYLEATKVPKLVIFSNGMVYSNQAFNDLLGYSELDLSLTSLRNLVFSDDLNTYETHIMNFIEGESEEKQLNIRYINKEGRIVLTETYLSILKSSDGKSVLFITVFDVTDNRRKTDTIYEQNYIFNTYIEVMNNMVFLKDKNLKNIVVNQAFADLFGKKQNEIIGKTDDEYMNKHSADVCTKSNLEALKTNAPVELNEYFNNRIYRAIKFPVKTNNNNIGVGGYIRDITDEYKKNKLLKKTSEIYKTINECFLKEVDTEEAYMNFVLERAVEISESEYGAIVKYDFKHNHLILCAISDQAKKDSQLSESMHYIQKSEFWATILQEKRSYIVNEGDFERFSHVNSNHLHIKIKNIIIVPIKENDDILTVISLANKPFDYTEDDLQAITILMTGVMAINEKSKKEKENQTLLKQLQSMFNSHESVMLVVDPASGRIIDSNPMATKFYGYSAKELKSMNIQEINTLPNDEVRKLRLQAASGKNKCFTSHHRLKNGEVRMVDVYSSQISYEGKDALFSIVFDVTEREEANERIKYISEHDYLTGLYNRRFFEQSFNEFNIKENFPLGLVMGDVNSLKLVNDSIGHSKGDLLLKEAANRLVRTVGEDAVIARVGGDEFAILIKNADERLLRNIVQKLENQNNENCKDLTEKNFLSIAFGYAIQNSLEDTEENLMKTAEGFLYASKYYDSKSVKSNTVNSFMVSLFEKSEREEAHSNRVGELSEILAKKMGLEKHHVDKIRTAGYLHDIGKIGINESILNKPARLNDEEWKIMKTHVDRSYRILKSSVEYNDISEMVYSHHENFDGLGYPRGLKREDIPLGARILAISDSFDAMTNQRTYQKAKTIEEAIEELKKFSGSQFDPYLVNIFIKMIQDGEIN